MSLPAASLPPAQSGLKRSAMLMRALGARAASVWSQLSPDEAKQLSSAMQALPENQIAEKQALKTYVRSMLQPAPGSVAPTQPVWARLGATGGAQIADLVQDESPQVIALILSRLPSQAAAQTVQALPRPIATEALKRMLSLGHIHPAALHALELHLEQALAQTRIVNSGAGHEQVARIFDGLTQEAEQSLLDALNTAEPGAGEKIRALMFTFEDLADLDPASLQTLLGSIDRSVLTVAMKGAPEPVAEALFRNITQRAGDLLREEIEAAGPIRRSEVETARAEIIALARTLVKRGDMLGQAADDELIE